MHIVSSMKMYQIRQNTYQLPNGYSFCFLLIVFILIGFFLPPFLPIKIIYNYIIIYNYLLLLLFAGCLKLTFLEDQSRPHEIQIL